MTTTHNPDDINYDEWYELALNSSFSSAFQTPESHALFASCAEFMPFFTAVTDDGNRIKGIISGAIHQNGLFPLNLLTRRAIVFGGPLLADDITDDELTALLNATINSLRKKAVYLEFRFTEDYSRFDHLFRKTGLTLHPALDAIVDTSSREVVGRSIQKRKHRQIRAALRYGIEVDESPTVEEIKKFYPRLRSLHWNASHKPIPSLEFFVRLAESPIGFVTLLKHEGKVIAMNAAFVLPGRKVYHLYSVGEDKRMAQLAPSSVALYTILHSAADSNIPLCDLMGAGIPSKPYGVRDFKIRMGAEILDYQRARKVFCPLIYNTAAMLFR